MSFSSFPNFSVGFQDRFRGCAILCPFRSPLLQFLLRNVRSFTAKMRKMCSITFLLFQDFQDTLKIDPVLPFFVRFSSFDFAFQSAFFLTADFLFPKVRHKHFLHGDLKLKCTATISTVYWKSNEESVQGSGFNAHTAPVSESRGRTSGTPSRLVPRDIILSASLSTRLYCACKVSICLLTTITSSLKSFKITPTLKVKLLSLYRYESYFRPTKY